MPEVTAAQRHTLNRDPVRDPHLVLLEFQEDGSDMIHRAVNNTEDVVWRGETYVRRAFDIKLPKSGSGETRARLTTSNIDRILGRSLDAATQRINVRIIFLDIAAPEPPLIDTKNLLVIPHESGMTELSVDLGPRASLLEPVGFRPTTEQDYPGAWFA